MYSTCIKVIIQVIDMNHPVQMNSLKSVFSNDLFGTCNEQSLFNS